ncbi:PucR family transcriptional regulator [Bilifractor sp. LCP19S3_H10]|uniref:PucR family transcriptional regulator n=1 Tax=Bilifractor sp. LCP19S3_H10 TaxID=3438736 RepID=UPI003F8E69F0
MYLSMWIIRDNLKEYAIDSHISGGEMSIRNVSLLFRGDNVSPHTVYICPSEDFIPTMKNRVICVNRNDYLVVDCGSMEEIYEKVQYTIDRYLEWDLHVRDLIDAHCSLQDITQEAANIFQEMVVVMNSGFILKSIAGRQYIEKTVPAEYADQLRIEGGMPLDHVVPVVKSLQSNLTNRNSYYFQEPILKKNSLVQNIFINGFFWGFSFVTLGRTEGGEAARQVFHVFNAQILRWWDRNGIVLEAPEQNAVFLRLLRQDPVMKSDTVYQFFRRIGWKDEDSKRVLRFQVSAGSELVYERLIHQISQLYSDCYVLQVDKGLMMVVNATHLQFSRFLQDLTRYLKPVDLYMGISYPFQDVMKLRQYFEQADIAMHYGERNGRRVMFCRECVVYYLQNILRKNVSIDLEHPVLKQLRFADRRNHTEYFHTLQVYLQEERSLVRASERLHIHKNTLLYRIRRIEDKYKVDLNDTQERTAIMVSFLMYPDQEADM